MMSALSTIAATPYALPAVQEHPLSGSRAAFTSLQKTLQEQTQAGRSSSSMKLYKHQCVAPVRELVNDIVDHLAASKMSKAQRAAEELKRLNNEHNGGRYKYPGLGSVRSQIDSAISILGSSEMQQASSSASSAPTPSVSLGLISRIALHVEMFGKALDRVLTCSSAGSSSCPGWWRKLELEWKSNATAALASRMELHARRWSELLSESEPCTLKDALRHAKEFKKPILERYWQQPDLSCGSALKRTGSSVKSSDGGKWLCGARSIDYVQPCRILSIGCNFEDDFERAMHKLASCRSLIFDPTLGREGSPKVLRFSTSLDLYGSRLNASVGLGMGSIVDRNGSRHALRPFADLVEGSGNFFQSGVSGTPHMTVAKIDAEGGEVCKGQSIPLCNLRAAP